MDDMVMNGFKELRGMTKGKFRVILVVSIDVEDVPTMKIASDMTKG